MINAMKTIQIILSALLILPSLYFIIREPFIKYKKYRKRRLITCGLTFLTSMITFIILSIIISYNDELYSSMKYAPFMQSWIIIKSTILVYIQLLSIIVSLIGIYGWFILVCEKRASKLANKLVDCNVPKKLSMRQKIEYPFMWYEIYVNAKISKDNYYILTEMATKDLLEFEAKEN